MSGTTRLTRRFRIEELREDAVWATLLEGAEKKGLQYGLRYGGFRDNLSEGEVVIATVESLNKRNTEWEIKELHTDTTRDRT